MADIPDLARTEIAIIEKTNALRRGEGLAPVVRNKTLDIAAKRFAEYLAKSGKFAHEADGRQPADRVKAAGYAYCTVAENLALNLDSRGFTVAKLADDVVEGWKNSPGHRKNMLLPHVTEIGVGIAQAPTADPKFLSVQLFGRPQSLSYTFKVQNKAASAVTYTFAGQTQQAEPRVTITHTACDPGQIRFTGGGGWLFGGTSVDRAFEARNSAVFVIRSGAAGKLEIDETR